MTACSAHIRELLFIVMSVSSAGRTEHTLSYPLNDAIESRNT